MKRIILLMLLMNGLYLHSQSIVKDVYNFPVKQGNSAGETISWNLSNQPRGIYIVTVYDTNSNSIVKTVKFVKNN
jgi:hypothetical protein